MSRDDLHALSTLGAALDDAKRLLFPFSLRRWVTLAIIAFLVSGVTGFNPNVTLSVGDPSGVSWLSVLINPVNADLSYAVLLVAVAALGGLLLAYLAAVMELVFVEVARTREVRIRGFFRTHRRAGAGLFGLRLAIGLIVAAPLLLFVFLTGFLGGPFLLGILILVPAYLVVASLAWVGFRLTDDFVVPVMVADGVGVLDGWKRFGPALRASTGQYAVYLLVRALLGVGAATVLAMGFATVALVLGLPLLVAWIGLLLAVDLQGLAGSPLIFTGLFVAYFTAVTVAGTVLVQVPVSTYLRYYALRVLGRTTPAYDLLGGGIEDGVDHGGKDGDDEEGDDGDDDDEDGDQDDGDDDDGNDDDKKGDDEDGDDGGPDVDATDPAGER